MAGYDSKSTRPRFCVTPVAGLVGVGSIQLGETEGRRLQVERMRHGQFIQSARNGCIESYARLSLITQTPPTYTIVFVDLHTYHIHATQETREQSGLDENSGAECRGS